MGGLVFCDDENGRDAYRECCEYGDPNESASASRRFGSSLSEFEIPVKCELLIGLRAYCQRSAVV